MANENPVEVVAWFSPGVVANPRGEQFTDRAGAMRVVTSAGRRLYMDISGDQGHGVHVTYAARNGIIAVNELTGEMTTSVREKRYRELPTTRYGMPALNAQEQIAPAEVVDSTAQVLRALLDGRDSVTGEHGRQAVEVLVAAHHSADNGSSAIRLGKAIDHDRVFPWA
jgi:hypothetical protein